MPNAISIGTSTGARSAHFADAEPTNRLTTPVIATTPTTVTAAGMAAALSQAAPCRATSTPRLDRPNSAMNSEAKNAMTM